MKLEQNFPKRKPTRRQNYDYNTVGTYFITICTQNRRKLLSLVGGDVLDAPPSVCLLPHGVIADKYIQQMNDFYPHLSVESYVIMPNHIHLMLYVFKEKIQVSKNGSSGTSTPTVRQHAVASQFVSAFKRFCNKEYGENIWQRHFNDHVIRNREDYERHLRYIAENPARWQYDELYTEE